MWDPFKPLNNVDIPALLLVGIILLSLSGCRAVAVKMKKNQEAMMFLTFGVKRSDEVICRQSLLFEDTDVMRSYCFMLHLMIIEVTQGGI